MSVARRGPYSRLLLDGAPIAADALGSGLPSLVDGHAGVTEVHGADRDHGSGQGSRAGKVGLGGSTVVGERAQESIDALLVAWAGQATGAVGGDVVATTGHGSQAERRGSGDDRSAHLCAAGN